MQNGHYKSAGSQNIKRKKQKEQSRAENRPARQLKCEPGGFCYKTRERETENHVFLRRGVFFCILEPAHTHTHTHSLRPGGEDRASSAY